MLTFLRVLVILLALATIVMASATQINEDGKGNAASEAGELAFVFLCMGGLLWSIILVLLK